MGVARGLPGGGPWMVLDGCTSSTHNTLRSSITKYNGGLCVCPRALVLREQHTAKERARSKRAYYKSKAAREAIHGPRPEKVETVRFIKPEVVMNAQKEDMSGALCPDYTALFDAAIDHAHASGRAKAVCMKCPARLNCERLIQTLEGEYPGSVAGVYAGLSVRDRMNGLKHAELSRAYA